MNYIPLTAKNRKQAKCRPEIFNAIILNKNMDAG